jgi:hypothetical protein
MRPDRHPPLAALTDLGSRLDAAGLGWGLGGSGLLVALGLAPSAGDWDLQADADIRAVERALAGLTWVRSDANGCHADHRLRLTAVPADVIVRFAFTTPRGRVRIPVAARGRWHGLPLASPEGWAVAYALLGELEGPESRRAKSEALFAHLDRCGVDDGTRDALLAQPLPAALAMRLRALPGARRGAPGPETADGLGG